MSLEILTLSDRERWSENLGRLPESQRDVYFTPEYYQLAEFNGEGIPLCAVFTLGDDVALYPFLLNEIDDEFTDIEGAYGYNGVISSTYETAFINAFHEAFHDYQNETRIVSEYTRFHPLLANQQFSKNHMDVVFNRKTVYLNLDAGYETIWKDSYASRTRNMVRKAKKEGFSAELSDDHAAFAQLYETAMTRLGAVDHLHHEADYFELTWALFGDNVDLHVVHRDGRWAAAALTLVHGRHAHYHLSARNAEIRGGAGVLALDHAVRHCVDRGCSTLHLGGGADASEDNSLLRFKKGFSSLLADFFIGKKVCAPEKHAALCADWEKRHPELVEKFGGMLQRYKIHPH